MECEHCRARGGLHARAPEARSRRQKRRRCTGRVPRPGVFCRSTQGLTAFKRPLYDVAASIGLFSKPEPGRSGISQLMPFRQDQHHQLFHLRPRRPASRHRLRVRRAGSNPGRDDGVKERGGSPRHRPVHFHVYILSATHRRGPGHAGDPAPPEEGRPR